MSKGWEEGVVYQKKSIRAIYHDSRLWIMWNKEFIPWIKAREYDGSEVVQSKKLVTELVKYKLLRSLHGTKE